MSCHDVEWSEAMKNSLEDLNNHLFAQIERLGEEDLKEEKLQLELNRTKAITSVATQIIQNGKLALEVQKALGEGRVKDVQKWLESK